MPSDAALPAAAPTPHWWRDAVFYQVYIRSFADGNGDGVGDLAGLRARLPYLADLGVDALWITPFYPSPMHDHGYDVADPRDVEPLFGDLPGFDAVLADAHALGLRVTIDLVPNHSSSEHVWFQEALAAAPGSPERARYLFRDGRGPDGDRPPNNWPSVFGGPAWTRVPDGQWYLHLFAPEQPDLDFTSPEVVADLERTLRFWLDRGVDGFRIDVAHGMAKPAGLPDLETLEETGLLADQGAADLRFDQDGVHPLHRRIRAVLDQYPDRMAVGEIWVDDARLARYLAPDELPLAFNFRLVLAGWSVEELRAAIADSLDIVAPTPAPACWVLSNHDVRRHVSRYGGGTLGVRRARAAALLQLALPGAVYLYNGDELGLPNVDDLPDEVLQDPVWERSGRTRRGRDGCRVPMPWSGDAPPFGFTTASSTWLPMPEEWAALTVEAQSADPGSMLSLYRAALALRASSPAFTGESLTWLPSSEGCLAFRRPGGLVCLVNLSESPVPLPEGRVLLTSSAPDGGLLPPDTAVWLAG